MLFEPWDRKSASLILVENDIMSLIVHNISNEKCWDDQNICSMVSILPLIAFVGEDNIIWGINPTNIFIIKTPHYTCGNLPDYDVGNWKC